MADESHEGKPSRAELLRDVQEKTREIERLQMQNLFLKTVFDGISEEIMIVDRDFNVLDANRVLLERHRLDRDTVTGRKCHEIKRETGAPCHIIENGCPLHRARDTGKMVEINYQHQDSGGENRSLSLIMYPIKLPGEGDIRYFMEIARDETRYRKLIGQIKASQKRFRSILDTATNAILSIDEDHRITLFNNAAERIFGYSREEVMGRDLGCLIPESYGDHKKYVKRFLEYRKPSVIGRTIRLTAQRKNGEEFPIELSLSFLELESDITITAIIRDITEHRRMEKMLLQNERLAAVGEAVAHVAHELKNPLMIIGGFTSQIRNAVRDKKILTKLDMILDEVARLERLVLELGDFTKEYRLLYRPADINSVLRDVVKVMGAAHPAGKYTIIANLDPALEEISCDPDKLKQVFLNIFSNGMEAMADGGVITVNSEGRPDGVEVRISDQGPGIPEKELQHIFEPFYTTRERGSGLGLAISYKIVRAHGGELTAARRPGGGAMFTVQLPLSLKFAASKEYQK